MKGNITRKYLVDFNNVNKELKRFIDMVSKKYPHLKTNTIRRRFYDCKRLDESTNVVLQPKYNNNQKKKKLLYVDEYKITNTKRAFVKLLQKHKPHLKESSCNRYFSRLKKSLGAQGSNTDKTNNLPNLGEKSSILQEIENQMFDPEEILPLTPLQKITWEDIKRLNFHKKSKHYLKRHGFNQRNINWLIQTGEL